MTETTRDGTRELSAIRGLAAVLALWTLGNFALGVGNVLLGSAVEHEPIAAASFLVAVLGAYGLVGKPDLTERLLAFWVAFLFATVGWWFVLGLVAGVLGIEPTNRLYPLVPLYACSTLTAILVVRSG